MSVDIMLAARGDPLLQTHLDTWVARMFDSYRDAGRHAFGEADLSRADCDALIATIASTLRGRRVAQMLAPNPATATTVRATLTQLLHDRLQKAAP
ncbi:MAG: hypothetical protein WBB25_10540 [Sulfitobacter sp.]